MNLQLHFLGFLALGDMVLYLYYEHMHIIDLAGLFVKFLTIHENPFFDASNFDGM